MGIVSVAVWCGLILSQTYTWVPLSRHSPTLIFGVRACSLRNKAELKTKAGETILHACLGQTLL